jgi:hypothetical protein
MSNSTHWMRRVVCKIKDGVGKAGDRLERAAVDLKESVNRAIEREPILLEIVTIWVRQVVLTGIELAIGSMLRRIMRRPKPPNVIPFPELHPVG